MKRTIVLGFLAALLAGLAPEAARAATSPYVEIPILVVIYTHYYRTAETRQDLTAADIETVQANVLKGIEQYWRGSHMRCHVKPTFMTVDRTLTPEQFWFFDAHGCWLPPWSVDGVHSVKQDVLDAGYQAGDFGSVVALYAFENDDVAGQAIGGGSYGPDIGVLGRAGYVGASFAWGYDVYGVFLHEYLHQLDSFFYICGNPGADMFHADWADQFPDPDDGGGDFNYQIMSRIPLNSWLLLDPPWAFSRSMADTDLDGVPDGGSLPLTEELLGTNRYSPDSDNDGVSDLDEVFGTYYGRFDPLSADSDGDLSIDGRDPHPLIRLSSGSIRRGTPYLDSYISINEYTELIRMEQFQGDIGGVISARWDPNGLYIAANIVDQTVNTPFSEVWWDDHLEIIVDTNLEHFLFDPVPGNYFVRIGPTGADSNALMDLNDLYLDPGVNWWHPQDASAVVAKYRTYVKGYVIETALPKSALPELTLEEGATVRLTFNLVDLDEWEWPQYNLMTGQTNETYAFVEFRLRGDTAGDEDVDADGDADSDDGLDFARCMGGADHATAPGGVAAAWFARGKFDADGDVDLADFGAFARSWSARQ